jgi:hypothetical protein
VARAEPPCSEPPLDEPAPPLDELVCGGSCFGDGGAGAGTGDGGEGVVCSRDGAALVRCTGSRRGGEGGRGDGVCLRQLPLLPLLPPPVSAAVGLSEGDWPFVPGDPPRDPLSALREGGRSVD